MIVLDYRDKRPINEQVTEKLMQLIVCGALKPDEKMPSVRALAMELSVNPNTIQRAYVALEQSGYIYTVNGRGNFVSPKEAWQKEHLGEIETELDGVLKEACIAGMSEEDAHSRVTKIWKENEAHD